MQQKNAEIRKQLETAIGVRLTKVVTSIDLSHSATKCKTSIEGLVDLRLQPNILANFR